MPTSTRKVTGVAPHGRGDAIRTVPLHLPEALTAHAGPAAAPHLSYRGGPLMTAVQVFTVFWGDAWGGAQAALADTVNKFFDDILTSSLIDQLGEYSIPGQAIGHGSRVGTIKVPAAHLPHSVADAAIRHMLQQEIATNHAFPAPGPNVLYFGYTPPKVAVVRGAAAPARPSAAITTTSTASSSTPSCPTPAARAAPAASR